MKWMLAGLKVGIVIGLGVCALGAKAATPLLKVAVRSEGNSTPYLSILAAKRGQTYPYAGIKFRDSHTVTGCTMNPKNGWCLFSVSHRVAKKLLLHSPSPLIPADSVDFQISLNAAGKHPISVQNVSVSSSGGRIIGYTYGWEPAIPASEIAGAGYTHVLIAFGLFTNIAPSPNTASGQVSLGALSGSGFGQPDDLYSYIKSLHDAGLKVLLSIGGASTNIPNTTVSFYEAELNVNDVSIFKTNFINSLKSLSDTYGFDGYDFDIESGLYAASTGNPSTDFTNPSGACLTTGAPTSECTSAYLIDIINTLYNDYYSYAGQKFLITMAPQLPQISATATYDSIFGLYSALVMQTYASLEWVAFQNYNSGCAYGIDGICYPTDGTTLTSSPDSAVAFSTDLLASWPQGTSRNFLPYTSYLTPSQVVIGYLVPNSQGAIDGEGPAVNIPIVKSAIQCLRTQQGCGTYTPPTPYPGIGGVFDWTINYDQTTGYQFATQLYDCVVGGNCS